MQVMNCDVLIIGAGASGTVAGLNSIKNGLKTIIVEKEKDVAQSTDNKIDLTESIGIEHIIKKLNLPIYETSNESKWFSPNNVLNFKSKIYDLYIKRGSDKDSFENINIKNILDREGILLTNTNLKKIEWGKNNFAKKIILKNDNEKFKIKPSFIIAADGTNSRLLELSGLSKDDNVYGEFHAIGLYGKKFNLPSRKPHVIFDKEVAPGGYIFTAKTRNDNCVLGLGIDPALTKKQPEKYFEKAKSHKIVSKIINKADIKNSFSGFGRYGILKKHSIGNILVAGDAGRFLDPLFCYGVRQSILSGYKAASICKKVMDENFNIKPSVEYESSIKKLQNEIKLGLFFRQVYKKLDNKNIDVIVKILSDAQKDGLNLDYFLKKDNKILTKNILKNGGESTKILLKALPDLLNYLLKIYHL